MTHATLIQLVMDSAATKQLLTTGVLLAAICFGEYGLLSGKAEQRGHLSSRATTRLDINACEPFKDQLCH